jgi:NAD(P)-dependent dehydrogenase (short-subunit alcohol dehydrogenase family)
MRLANKVALITGAAHGMGEAMARLFAREGAKVILADILEAEGRQVTAAINGSGGHALYLSLDVQDEARWVAVMGEIEQRYGRLDIVVNNAGISGAVPDRLDVAYFDKLTAVNLRGTFLGVKYAIEAMKKTGGGSIVNFSSISGLIGQDGIRVNSVHPGMMPPMRTSVTAADPAVRARALAAVPLGRAGTAEEAAYAALFLASDEASYITGAEIIVDGGYTAA